MKREGCKSCSRARAEQCWGRDVRPGRAGRAKALLSAAWLAGRREHASSSSFMSYCPRAGGAMAGMKFHCQYCQPDGQSSFLPPPEGVERPSRMETSRTQRGEAAFCLRSLLQLVLGLSYKVISPMLDTTSVLWVTRFNEYECLHFIYALRIRNLECSYSRFIITFLTVTIGLWRLYLFFYIISKSV